ncbi:MAG: undecaprenyldiphospho-muramoylpentapeptide beta-N-acetylglucosaminyltransferase [Deltaproteobacteria bacterium]|nr:undecaprenyldiphospho-muramoylpentapeptide beta-N-acetylglucosaminyltransferase [Deltaproteobacteria bacterium]
MTSSAKPLRVLIAGGGTGGHLFPGLAIAGEFRRQVPDCQVAFAGSAYGLEARVVPREGYPLYLVPVRGLYGVAWWKKLRGVLLLPLAFITCLWMLIRFRPHVVVGVGGYASGPVLATAVLLRRFTVIQEQNAYPGMTNRLLGRWVRRAFVPVAGLEHIFPRAVVAGNPVRKEILALQTRPAPEREVPLVFILGGSQGARAVNRAVVAALPWLEAWGKPLRVLHQTGRADQDWVAQGYASHAVPHTLTPFIDDMAQALWSCSLLVSRSGASSVNEIAAAGRPAILIPIPGTSGDHQLKNARRMEQAGAAVVLEQQSLTGEKLAQAVIALLEDPQRLKEMEARSLALSPGDAAKHMVRECLNLVGKG